MGYDDTNDVLPNSPSCHSCIMSPIVDLNDEFLKEGQLTENNTTGINDVIPNIQSCRFDIMSLIVDLTDEFSKEGQLTENNITCVYEPHRPIFKEKDLQLFRDARHESLCYNNNGKLVRCRICRGAFSPIDLVDATLGLKMEHMG